MPARGERRDAERVVGGGAVKGGRKRSIMAGVRAKPGQVSAADRRAAMSPLLISAGERPVSLAAEAHLGQKARGGRDFKWSSGLPNETRRILTRADLRLLARRGPLRRWSCSIAGRRAFSLSQCSCVETPGRRGLTRGRAEGVK